MEQKFIVTRSQLKKLVQKSDKVKKADKELDEVANIFEKASNDIGKIFKKSKLSAPDFKNLINGYYDNLLTKEGMMYFTRLVK